MNEPAPDSIESLHNQRDCLLVTPSSMGDVVITIDAEARVTFLNSVAVSLTGWTLKQAVGQPLYSVF